MSYIEIKDGDHHFLNLEEMENKGSELRETYCSASPFPHIVIDDFLTPEILDECLKSFPQENDPESVTFNRDQERFKTGFNPDYLPPNIRSLFYSLNSRPFLKFLENLTGIQGLIADPYFIGGGFHRIKQGGHLSVHADFNHHTKLNLERRINVLIYLNKNWAEEYGGQIELWDEDMKNCIVSKTPEFNRCVIFNTTSNSYHGNPQPINHPDNVPRRSIALYYYTATWDGSRREHSTQFKARPKSDDAVDWAIKLKELADDYFPPVLVRIYRRIKRKIRSF
ncbi:MAG TPA: 2OG-Fe(II) oxygenase [Emcibacteraceae bacterium]|nr:2OG-Fe(II) oxygenase [Emcibacteraceae bacterium]